MQPIRDVPPSAVGPSRMERVCWLAATVVSGIASMRLWKGYALGSTMGCYFCAPPTLFRFVVNCTPSMQAFSLAALCTGIFAISFIQFMRPTGSIFAYRITGGS